MKPRIEATTFGSITIDGQEIENDVLLRLDGSVKKRKKKLSKKVYGTSHTISLDEAKYVYEKGAELLIIGTGQYDLVRLSDEADNIYTFPDFSLWGGGAINVHTTGGSNTTTDLYWDSPNAVWDAGELVTLSDAEGTVIATYTVSNP